MKRIEKGTWYSRVEEILCRDFGNLYTRLAENTQQMLLDNTHLYVTNRRDLEELSEMEINMLVEEHVASCIARSFRY
tara:strand:- start:169 stop:399 length:231 start_codon:yes stop_codon:yes gene_type:complete